MATEVQRWAPAATIAALEDYPCLRCLSDQQLFLVLAIVLCRILQTDPDNDCTAAALVEDASCSQCFSDRQLFQMTVAIIAKYAADNGRIGDLTALIEEAVCLNCADPKKVRGMVVDQIQIGINNGTLFNPA